jgi:hypothetical protein
MFCPSCGFEYTQKTNYCKRCGEELNLAGVTDTPKKKQPNVAGMFSAVGAFCLLAVALILTAYDHFSGGGLQSKDEKLLTFASLFLSVVAFLLIWQLARMVTAFRRAEQKAPVEKHSIREVPTSQPAPKAQILEAIDQPSVVEHTTRRMADVYGEPKLTK